MPVSDPDWNRCYEWMEDAKRKLAQIEVAVSLSDAQPQTLAQVKGWRADTVALIDGIFGTAQKARQRFEREAEKLHAAREAWEDEHGSQG